MNICLVEDEKDLSEMLEVYLQKEGYRVITCANLKQAREQLTSSIQIYVIDIMLTDGNGLELLKEVKFYNPKASTIIISAKGDRFDRVAGFEIGCDDYIAKPFLPAELVFRVNKLIHKHKLPNPLYETPHPTKFIVSGYNIDIDTRIVYQNNQRIDLTSREFDLLLYLIKNKGLALSREQLLDGVWGADYYGNDRIVDNHIKNLRKKLCKLNVETIYGYGYRYNHNI